jgi:hypothetical protein
MVKLALLSRLTSLEMSRPGLEFWLDFWTLLVAGGVAIEVVTALFEYCEDLREFNRGTVVPPEKPDGFHFLWRSLLPS